MSERIVVTRGEWREFKAERNRIEELRAAIELALRDLREMGDLKGAAVRLQDALDHDAKLPA